MQMRSTAPDHNEPSAVTVADTHLNVRSLALTVIALAVGMYVLQWAQEVFIPIVLSVLVSYALEPVVLGLMRLRLPRILASGVVVALLTGTLGYTAYALSDDAAAIVAQLPEAATKLRETLRREGGANGAIENVKRAAEELQKTADEATAPTTPTPARRGGVQRVQIDEPAINVREYLSWGSASLFAFGGQAILIIFFVFFLLASGDMFKRKLVRVVGPSLEK